MPSVCDVLVPGRVGGIGVWRIRIWGWCRDRERKAGEARFGDEVSSEGEAVGDARARGIGEPRAESGLRFSSASASSDGGGEGM